MPRFRRALAGAAMAVAMAGSGMVAAMAGAAPAHAATTPTPAAVSHTFGFTIAPAAQAGGGIGPKLQCGDTCDPGGGGGGGNPPPSGPTTITCTLTVTRPHLVGSAGNVLSHADAVCSDTLPQINLQQEVFYNGREVDFGGKIVVGTDYAFSNLYEACAPGGQWQSEAWGYLTLPAGWVIVSGTNPMFTTSLIGSFNCP
jgi:hypothetical protein